MTFVSYAQNFEDVLLWRALGSVGRGFYIDVGASHPDNDSVTRAFYDRGWTGINVEPTEAAFGRLVAARPRDTNLRLAVAAGPGSATFFSVDDQHTGLSTLDAATLPRLDALGIGVTPITVPTDSLANICRAHAPGDIHFLKVDVEGAERTVLESGDFAAFRPWIVLAEATAPMSTAETHAEWEPILLAAGYRFAWFDGLNRYYLADERWDALSPYFRTPPNVFDDFLRAADTEWTRRLTLAEARADALAARVAAAERSAAVAEDRSEAAHLRLARLGAEAALTGDEAARLRTRLAASTEALDATAAALRGVEGRTATIGAERDAAHAWLDAMRRSTSWRVTAPIRRLRGPRDPVPPVPSPVEPAPPPAAPATPPMPPPAAIAPRRAVHQFHSGTAFGDATTNALLLTRGILRGLGFDSRIFAEHLDPALADEIHALADLPDGDGYVLLVHHSMGHGALDRILALPVRKVLIYHNITPPELLEHPFLQHHARLGRDQLARIRPAVDAALADSAFNALELRRLGFPTVAACTLLFDLDALAAEWRPRPPGPIFTILCVGRIAAAKGQVDLVDAYARFRAHYRGESCLVLVGRTEGAPAQELLARIKHHGLVNGEVEMAGLLSDDELRRRYADADLFVTLSRHEGFGVPLIEAAARGIPVLAVDNGAVGYTLGADGPDGGVLPDATPATACAAMLDLAHDAAARAALAARQRAAAARFALARQLPALRDALGRAGAALPPDAELRAALAARARFTVAGHVNGSYSLAAINRALALALDAARPGTARLLPVEGAPTTDVHALPPTERAALRSLLARPGPTTGPHVVISQHYPVWVPPEPGDVPLALFFWEESRVPAETIATLNAGFRGVVAPSAPVAKALIDSGIAVPVRVIPPAANLADFAALAAERAATAPDPARPVTFLHVSSCFPRKGVDVLLAAWARAFTAVDPVRLVIKGFPNPHNTVAADLARLRAAHPDLAPVTLVDADLDRPALLDLYRSADAVVLPTRGEGWNLPAAEALAAGLPLIVTGWGGHADHLPADARVRPLRFAFAPSGSHLAPPFSLWAEPDEDDLVAALRERASCHPLPSTPEPARSGPAMREPAPHESAAPAPARTEPTAPRSDTIADAFARFAADILTQDAPAPPSVGWITTWDVRCGVAEYARHLVDAVGMGGTVFADLRTAAATTGDVRIVPAWSGDAPDSLATLMSALIRRDPRAVVIQHQPGLFPWRHLPALLRHPALHGRVVCITMHNTRDLFASPPDVVAAVAEALARMSRVVVHTITDVNALRRLGLATTLIPQGAPPVADNAPRPADLDPASSVTIASTGFFLPGKGLPQLVAALPLLRRTWSAARLALVNAEYPLPQSAGEIATCRDLAQAVGLADAVDFHTAFAPPGVVPLALRAAAVVALPYQTSQESSSAALRSAMATGIPVAVTPLPLFQEAGDAAVRLPGTDPASIAAGLDALLRDTARRRETAAAAATWLADRAWPAIGRQWAGLLCALETSGVRVASQ